MTYEGLLEAVDLFSEKKCEQNQCEMIYRTLWLLIELHYSQEITLPNGEKGTNCNQCDGYSYPCATLKICETQFQ